MFYGATLATRFGPFSVAVDEQGAVVATTFGELANFRRLAVEPNETRCADAMAQLATYDRDARQAFDLPLAPQGTDFQRAVWQELRRIPPGEVRTYRDIAVAVGKPKGSQAVGQANGANPICLIVPCHRVIGSDGSMTGFAYGEEMKRALLRHEGALLL